MPDPIPQCNYGGVPVRNPTAAQEHIVPDVGELGMLPSRLHWAIRFYGSLACNITSFILFILFVSGVPRTDTGNNVLAGSMLGLWMAANLARRLTPLLWTEPGKMTYTRISRVITDRAPSTPRGRLAVVTLLADMVLLPLTMAFGTFHSVFPFSLFGFYLYPPPISSPAPMIVFFVMFGVLGFLSLVFAFSLVFPSVRLDPFCYDPGGDFAFLPTVASVTSAGLAMPLMMWSCAAMPCQGGHLKYLATASSARAAGTAPLPSSPCSSSLRLAASPRWQRGTSPPCKSRAPRRCTGSPATTHSISSSSSWSAASSS